MRLLYTPDYSLLIIYTHVKHSIGFIRNVVATPVELEAFDAVDYAGRYYRIGSRYRDVILRLWFACSFSNRALPDFLPCIRSRI